MGTVEATPTRGAIRKGTAAPTRAAPKVSATQLRDLLDRALAEVDADDRAGSLLRAAGLRIRLICPDVGLTLSVAPSEEGRHHLRWTFADPPEWKPALELTMSSRVANAYLQGGESLAIAIARRRVRCTGEARTALRYLPAMRFLVDAYRRRVREDYPELAI